ncbi:MAG: ribonuclease HII [Candidatus Parcubacteria bacterium]|nr:MAG: ribonuclease HII [Candidatus Parcubacteria bacterium]
MTGKLPKGITADRQWLLSALRTWRDEGVQWVAGFDEAGRGALAGPVVVGVWLWSIEEEIAALTRNSARDSKSLTPLAREAAYDALRSEQNGRHSVGFSSAREIDRWGMARALTRAARRAARRVLALTAADPSALVVLCDGSLTVPLAFARQCTIVRADTFVPSVAHASVVAKVSRDVRMRRLALRYPLWQFSLHKGYGTALHRRCIQRHGASPEHRATFLRNLREEKNVLP